MTRCNWDDYFMQIVNVVASRATCDRGRSAAVIVKNNHILATGYVGSPTSLPHCDDVGHELIEVIEGNERHVHCVRTLHAEQNAICQAAKFGISIDGATMYCTMTPCIVCAKLIIQCGIKRVVAKYKYQRHNDSENLFKQCGVDLEIINNIVLKYE